MPVLAVAKQPGAPGSAPAREVVPFDDTDFYVPSLDELFGITIYDETDTVYHYGLREDIVGYAKDFVGIRYRYGGKGPQGFDCSGFTGYLFRQFGYVLGASSSIQGSQGEAVDEYLHAEPGDLIFFSGSRVSNHIGHVGMVVDVDTTSRSLRFIHASIGKGVVIDRYPDGGYYSRRFIGVRRVL